MALSAGNIVFLVIALAAFGVFILSVGYAHLRCVWPERKPRPLLEAAVERPSLKVHGDKLSHSVDAAL